MRIEFNPQNPQNKNPQNFLATRYMHFPVLSSHRKRTYTLPCSVQSFFENVIPLPTDSSSVSARESQKVTFMFYVHVLGRVLCLSWHQSDNTLVTGASDSTVRLYNVTSGMRCLHFYLKPCFRLLQRQHAHI